MKSLTVREVPDDVYATLKKHAKKNHRSLQEQMRLILIREAKVRGGSTLERARRWRRKMQGRNLGDAAEDIRSARADR
jgi:plasmid stability protein